MTIKIIEPKDYLKGLKYSLLPKNNLDTLKGSYIPNTYGEETLIDSVTLDHTDDGALPIEKDVNQSNYNYNEDNYLTNIHTTQKYQTQSSNIGAGFSTAEYTFISTRPIASPRVVITLHGKSYKGTAEKYSDLSGYTLAGVRSALWSAADSGEDFSTTSKNVIYENNKVPLIPFIKKIASDGSYVNEANLRTQWDYHDTAPAAGIIDYGGHENWTVRNNSNKRSVKSNLTDHMIMQYTPIEENMLVEIQVIDQFTIKVKVKIPNYVVGWDRARYVRQQNGYEWSSDNYKTDISIFLDKIFSFDIELYARPIDISEHDFGYSLDNQEHLTTNLINMNVFELIKNEYVTLRTKWGEEDYITSLSEYILKSYKVGKYSVEFEVYMDKYLQKELQVGDQISIKQQDGAFISRYDEPVVFVIKTIEKISNKDSYYVRIKAMEASYLQRTVDEIDPKKIYAAENSIYTGEDIFFYNDTVVGGDLSDGYHFDEDVRTLGYSIAKCSTGLKAGQTLKLPGNKIGTKVFFILTIFNTEVVTDDPPNFVIGTTDFDQEWLTPNRYYRDGNTYYAIALDISSWISNPRFFFNFTNSGGSGGQHDVKLQVFNCNNLKATTSQCFYYLQSRGLL